MEGIMEDFDEGDAEEIKSEYEFDAPHFFDFSRGDTVSEDEDAENWFRYAHEYPPSPLIAKLKLMKAAKSVAMQAHKINSSKNEANRNISTSSNSDCDNDYKAATREVKIKGVKHYRRIPQGSMKARSKSVINLSKQSSGSSFMKPTASHLARQNKECDIHSRGSGRNQLVRVKSCGVLSELKTKPPKDRS